jgi:hypothetical protein
MHAQPLHQNPSTPPITCQHPDQIPIPCNQGLLLGPPPSFEFMFCSERIIPGDKTVGPDQSHWPALRRVAAQSTSLVLSKVEFDIVRVPGIITAVVATQEVGVEGHRARG